MDGPYVTTPIKIIVLPRGTCGRITNWFFLIPSFTLLGLLGLLFLIATHDWNPVSDVVWDVLGVALKKIKLLRLCVSCLFVHIYY